MAPSREYYIVHRVFDIFQDLYVLYPPKETTVPRVFYIFQYLDVWHPLERAQYPEYFALREQRKIEFIEAWEKKYGKPESTAH